MAGLDGRETILLDRRRIAGGRGTWRPREENRPSWWLDDSSRSAGDRRGSAAEGSPGWAHEESPGLRGTARAQARSMKTFWNSVDRLWKIRPGRDRPIHPNLQTALRRQPIQIYRRLGRRGAIPRLAGKNRPTTTKNRSILANDRPWIGGPEEKNRPVRPRRIAEESAQTGGSTGDSSRERAGEGERSIERTETVGSGKELDRSGTSRSIVQQGGIRPRSSMNQGLQHRSRADGPGWTQACLTLTRLDSRFPLGMEFWTSQLSIYI